MLFCNRSTENGKKNYLHLPALHERYTLYFQIAYSMNPTSNNCNNAHKRRHTYTFDIYSHLCHLPNTQESVHCYLPVCLFVCPTLCIGLFMQWCMCFLKHSLGQITMAWHSSFLAYKNLSFEPEQNFILNYNISQIIHQPLPQPTDHLYAWITQHRDQTLTWCPCSTIADTKSSSQLLTWVLDQPWFCLKWKQEG